MSDPRIDGPNSDEDTEIGRLTAVPGVVISSDPDIPIRPPTPTEHASRNGSFRQDNDIPRMVRRDLPAYQSRNQFAVAHHLNKDLCSLLQMDWFHVVLNQPVAISLFALLVIWTIMILVFAGIYTKIDRESPEINCGLGKDGEPIKFGAAFAFSLETCTTVGYGLPSGSNAYFEQCGGLQVTIYAQMVWSMLFNAFLFAFFYTSLAKANKRGFQVLFSSRAIVSAAEHNKNQVRLQIRIYDMDARNPVVEAHVRLYAWSRRRPVPRPLRILQPNDDLGALLFMSMPTVVTHHVDVYSLLHPPIDDYPVDPSGSMLRSSDSAVAAREEVICPVCGEGYGTHERWVKHVRYNKMMESNDGWPVKGSHLTISEEELKKEPAFPISDIDILKRFFEEEMAEILCVVEGIDPLVSGTFQALQSYKKEDIVWHKDAHFQPCLNVDGNLSSIEVNLDDFHNIVHKEKSGPLQRQTSENSLGRGGRRRRRRRKMTSHRTHDSFMSNAFDS